MKRLTAFGLMLLATLPAAHADEKDWVAYQQPVIALDRDVLKEKGTLTLFFNPRDSKTRLSRHK